MLPSLDNFVSFGGDVIKSRPDYITMLVDIYTESITNDQLGQNDRVNGSKLAECLLLHLRGGIDHVDYFFFSNVVQFAYIIHFILEITIDHQHCAQHYGRRSDTLFAFGQSRSTH